MCTNHRYSLFFFRVFGIWKARGANNSQVKKSIVVVEGFSRGGGTIVSCGFPSSDHSSINCCLIGVRFSERSRRSGTTSRAFNLGGETVPPRAVTTSVHGVFRRTECTQPNPRQFLLRAGVHRHVRGRTRGPRGGDHRGCAGQALPATRPEERRRGGAGLRRKNAGADGSTPSCHESNAKCFAFLRPPVASNSAKFVATLVIVMTRLARVECR